MTRRLFALLLLIVPIAAMAGGPQMVGGPAVGSRPAFGVDASPFTWSPARMPIQYRVDPGPMAVNGASTIVSNATGLNRLQSMFGVWQGLSTARVSFSNAGAVRNTGAYTGGDIRTVQQFNAVAGSCESGTQNPVIFDADGSLISALGLPREVIGFSSICSLDGTNGYIQGALVVMNGKFQDNTKSSTNYELTANQFDETITHEIGHFLGLDHSQINLDMLTSYTYPCSVEGLRGLPLMFPIEFCQARKDAGVPMLSPDDASWLSALYPSTTFVTSYATVSGRIYFSDELSAMQGVNVIARRVDDPSTPVNETRAIGVSAVSGYLFSANLGQDVTALLGPDSDNTYGWPNGSRDTRWTGYYQLALPPGTYTIQVEAVDPGFSGGSSVGPLSPPIEMIAPAEYWNNDDSPYDFVSQRDTITVTPGQSIEDLDIILNSSPPRFDSWEDDGLLLWPLPAASGEVRA